MAVLATDVLVIVAAVLMPALVAAWGAWAVGLWAVDRRRAASERVEDPPSAEWPTYDNSLSGASPVRSSALRNRASTLSLPILGACSVVVAIVAMAVIWPALNGADSNEVRSPSEPTGSSDPSSEPQLPIQSAEPESGPTRQP